MKNVIICLFLLIFSNFEENNNLYKVWEKQSDIRHEWQNFGYQYIQFTEDNKFLFLKGNGEVVKEYSYDISKDKFINLSNGNRFGQILSLKETEMVLEKEIRQGTNSTLILSDSYIPIENTKITESITNGQQHILENKWENTVISHSNDTAVISMDFHLQNMNQGIMDIQGNGFERKYLVEVLNFEGSYSIYLEDEKRPRKADFYKIEVIGLNEIQIVFYELPNGRLVLKRK